MITAPLTHSALGLAVIVMPAVDRRARDNSKSYHYEAVGSGSMKDEDWIEKTKPCQYATIPRSWKE
jgi:hypothetical protein